MWEALRAATSASLTGNRDCEPQTFGSPVGASHTAPCSHFFSLLCLNVIATGKKGGRGERRSNGGAVVTRSMDALVCSTGLNPHALCFLVVNVWSVDWESQLVQEIKPAI